MNCRRFFALMLASITAYCTAPASAQTPTTPMKMSVHHTTLTWYGHSAYRIITPQGHILYIDPWLQNPLNPDGKRELAAIDQADLVLISHGHFDHVGDATAIVSQTKARLVTNFELGSALAKYAAMPADRMGFDSLGNVGGTLSFFHGEVKITFIEAIHSSSVNAKSLGVSDDDTDHPAGGPTGFVITIRNGPTIYHTGDTAYFGDMAQLARYHVDVMLVCIGDHFTMGPQDAARAVVAVHPLQAIPMHYGTFPVLTGTPAEFHQALLHEHAAAHYRELHIGETLSY